MFPNQLVNIFRSFLPRWEKYFYSGASGIQVFKDRFTGYKSSKGAVQFPVEKPMPYELIRETVRFRVNENIKEAERKPGKRKK